MTPPFPATLRAVLFDLDGTLVDTAGEFVPVVQALRAEHGHGPMDEQRIRASVSNGARALVMLGLAMGDDHPEFEARRLRLLELYSEVVGTRARPYPGIEPLLATLAGRGIAWGISTNKPRPYTEPLMAGLGLQPPAASTVCPEDVARRKPDPECLLRNCAEIGCGPREAIYIGDHARDIEAGNRAGMYTIAAAYGYIEPGDDPHAWGADAVARASTDLHELIFNPEN